MDDEMEKVLAKHGLTSNTPSLDGLIFDEIQGVVEFQL